MAPCWCGLEGSQEDERFQLSLENRRGLVPQWQWERCLVAVSLFCAVEQKFEKLSMKTWSLSLLNCMCTHGCMYSHSIPVDFFLFRPYHFSLCVCVSVYVLLCLSICFSLSPSSFLYFSNLYSFSSSVSLIFVLSLIPCKA